MSNKSGSGSGGSGAIPGALKVIMATYVAVTFSESVLAPALPIVSLDLGLDTASSARILGVLSLCTGIGNLLGGWLLGIFSARFTSITAALGSIAGCMAAALAAGELEFLAAHVLIGLSAGIYFAGGVFSVGVLAGPMHRGRAMGRYGIAYSLALALAAGVVAVFGRDAWRLVFVIGAVLSAAVALALTRVQLPTAEPLSVGEIRRSVRLLGVPALVGGVAALAQFGLVSYIPLFGVNEWGLPASMATSVLLAGRVLSIPAKAWSGAMVDRLGAKSSARIVGVAMVGIGLVWLYAPFVVVGAVAAVILAATAGAMFPMANVVAVERFSTFGGLLGVFRSGQMIVAGVSAWSVGIAAEFVGLTTALAAGTLLLLLILFVKPTSMQVQSAPDR